MTDAGLSPPVQSRGRAASPQWTKMPSAIPGRSNQGSLATTLEPPLGSQARPKVFRALPDLPFLCAFFCNARAQKCLESYPTLKVVGETQEYGGVTWG